MTPVPSAVLAKLLHIASPPRCELERQAFYGLKEQLLNLHGFPCGEDLQRTEATCWDCGGKGSDGEDECYRCDGSGVWEYRYFRLQRWRWGAFVFYRPVGRLFGKPAGRNVTFLGPMKHRTYPPGTPAVAMAVLASMFRRGTTFAGQVCRDHQPVVQFRINGALYEFGLYRHCGDRRHLILAMRDVYGRGG